MRDTEPSKVGGIRWESSHVCARCGSATHLSEIALRAITTGIVTCPKCDWSGPIEIRIVDADESGK